VRTKLWSNCVDAAMVASYVNGLIACTLQRE